MQEAGPGLSKKSRPMAGTKSVQRKGRKGTQRKTGRNIVLTAFTLFGLSGTSLVRKGCGVICPEAQPFRQRRFVREPGGFNQDPPFHRAAA